MCSFIFPDGVDSISPSLMVLCTMVVLFVFRIISLSYKVFSLSIVHFFKQISTLTVFQMNIVKNRDS